MKVYIAGPMSGIDNDNRDAFNQVARELQRKGFIVLNPATLPAGLEQHEYMDICLAMLRTVDVIYLLPGWQHSAGATTEYHYAYKIGLKVFIDGNEVKYAGKDTDTVP